MGTVVTVPSLTFSVKGNSSSLESGGGTANGVWGGEAGFGLLAAGVHLAQLSRVIGMGLWPGQTRYS